VISGNRGDSLSVADGTWTNAGSAIFNGRIRGLFGTYTAGNLGVQPLHLQCPVTVSGLPCPRAPRVTSAPRPPDAPCDLPIRPEPPTPLPCPATAPEAASRFVSSACGCSRQNHPMKPTPAIEPPPLTVSLIPVLRDNYVFVIHGAGPGPAAVVDPAVAGPVIAWLESRDLELVAILHTHHHSDHIGGAPDLLHRWPSAAVIAAAADRARIPHQTMGVADGDRLSLLSHSLEVLAVPGHTAHHIAFVLHPYPEPASNPPAPDLFCGDTLFAGGCGRLFEGTPAQMKASLERLAALPEATRVWCAHEYTLTNLTWAIAECPEDGPIAARLAAVRRLRADDLPTIPSSIALERATNLFLRADDAEELGRLRQSRNAW
jgi:hydroxyacylglutathione hydrolase